MCAFNNRVFVYFVNQDILCKGIKDTKLNSSIYITVLWLIVYALVVVGGHHRVVEAAPPHPRPEDYKRRVRPG